MSISRIKEKPFVKHEQINSGEYVKGSSTCFVYFPKSNRNKKKKKWMTIASIFWRSSSLLWIPLIGHQYKSRMKYKTQVHSDWSVWTGKLFRSSKLSRSWKRVKPLSKKPFKFPKSFPSPVLILTYITKRYRLITTNIKIFNWNCSVGWQIWICWKMLWLQAGLMIVSDMLTLFLIIS